MGSNYGIEKEGTKHGKMNIVQCSILVACGNLVNNDRLWCTQSTGHMARLMYKVSWSNALSCFRAGHFKLL